MTTYAIDATTVRSPNHSPRPKAISAIVLHTGEGTRASDLRELTDDTRPLSKRVSSGYYVCRDGTILQLVDDSQAAWHAGPGSYLGLTNWNDFSIGIETEHATGQDWPAVQKDALRWLCLLLIAKHGITRSRIIAHRWLVRPPGASKKFDPSNWPDLELAAWIADLYTPAGPALPPGTFPVDPKLQGYWERSGGLWQKDRYALGYAISPLENGVQKFERGALRLNPDGTISALLRQEW